MKVQLLHGLGRGWQTHDIPEAKTLGEAAYLSAKKSVGLKDDDHTYTIEYDIPIQCGGKNYTYNSVKFYRNDKSPYCDLSQDDQDYWFSYSFRAVPPKDEE